MKRIGLLLLTAGISFASVAQNTVDVFSTGALGSFTTGFATPTTRSDNSMVVSATPPPSGRRGYAVFNLAAIPASAVVTDVELRFNVEAYAAGFGFGSTTRGYVGDLSTITTPATLFTTMGAAAIIYTATYVNGLGNKTVASEPAAESFVDVNKGGVVSVIWTLPTATRVFTITGETGVPAVSGTHAPFLRITYNCPGITGLTATPPATTPCPNTAFDLSGSATGAVSYNWTGPLGFTSTTTDPTVSTGLPSSGTYTFTVTDATGCSASTTVFVPVSPPPTTIINPLTSTAFCEGETATLAVPPTPGATYQWYNGTLPIAGATNDTYIADTSGSFKVEVVDVNGCTDITAVATPVVKLTTPPVTPSDSVLLCKGDNGTVTVSTNGVTSGITFQWQKNGVNITGAIGSSYTVSASGLYRCNISVTSTTCTATSEVVYVDVNDYPVPVVSMTGATLSTANVFAVYQWFLNTVAIPGATSYNYTPGIGGNYRVRVTDNNGCTAYSAGYFIPTVGISTIAAQAVKIYPNPVSDVLKIEVPFNVKVVMSSIEGKIINEFNNPTSISLGGFSSGLYFLSMYNEAGELIKVEKITKK
jgi:hypothetical protein